MRVGLVDVDGAGRSVYPNLALMKISAWHKAQGDSVEWANPRFLKAYLRAGKKWWDSHPNVGSVRKFRTVYDLFVHNVFYDSYDDFCVAKSGMFGELDCKKFLEDYFGIELE